MHLLRRYCITFVFIAKKCILTFCIMKIEKERKNVNDLTENLKFIRMFIENEFTFSKKACKFIFFKVKSKKLLKIAIHFF